MKQQLSISNTIGLGFMLFAMFLGAGNMIFPPMVGFLSGTNLWPAAVGFLITAVGLPLLGIIATAQVGGGFNDLARELPKSLIILAGSCVFLIIGPLYAVPRTALVSFEMGIQPFIGAKHHDSIQLIFSLVFFAITAYLCLRPGRLLDSIGKIITPALIILLGILGLSPLFQPSRISGTPVDGIFSLSPLAGGFLEGYMTMDALAAIMFGIVMITNLRSHGIHEQKSQIHYCIITGFIAALSLSLVYLSLLYLGASSTDLLPHSVNNGSQILSFYVDHLYGFSGSILLSIIVILACLTTAIGCITAACEYFDNLLPIRYSRLVFLCIITCVLLANLQLNRIIDLFIPVLQVLYPPCIVLIFLGLIRHYLINPTLVYRSTLGVTLLISVSDTLYQSGYSPVANTLSFLTLLPGSNVQMGWILPAAASMALTVITGLAKNHKQANDHSS
ncbi:Branched-chain amino acid transport system 2 carrier protein [invertebrate metagenome]|uniref:Branched-chain amino acid transport system 2 carrier protein n=1 Tax=invertebrate metagenome TaxID=1711999 RepID=A0A2H9TAC4_9ZZZZ